jgi:hypothetical protein
VSTDIDHDRRHFLGRAAMTIAGSRFAALLPSLHALGCAPASGSARGELSSLRGATTWLNSPPLTAEALRGRVVLVDFGTYTCINWLRTLPYVRAWAGEYGAQGLTVICAHTPEFSFEHDLTNVRRALADQRVAFAVAVDNEYAIWNGFRNRFWPAVYLVDARGTLRFRHFGEGEYVETEQEIRRLLAESGAADTERDPAPFHAEGIEVAADWGSLGSPETYLGHARAERLASPGGIAADRRRSYVAPPRLASNRWALAGEWTVGREAAVLDRANGRIAYRFRARDVHLVLGPPAPGATVRFRVRIDGEAPGTAAGRDVDARGDGRVTEPRLYQLVRQSGPIGERTFEIEFLDPGAAAYAFTFG